MPTSGETPGSGSPGSEDSGSESGTTILGSDLDEIQGTLDGRDSGHDSEHSYIITPELPFTPNLDQRLGYLLRRPACYSLVNSWLEKWANFDLAGPFTRSCLNTALALFCPRSQISYAALADNLSLHSSQVLDVNASTTLDDFCGKFFHRNARWETLGLFLTAVSRAATEASVRETLPRTGEEPEKELEELWVLAKLASDLCVYRVLSIDGVDDLKLVLLYENYILHSMLDGEQTDSSSEKRLNDVVGSLLAPAYNLYLGISSVVPPFLLQLRCAAIARIYSADRNASIFLARLPRIDRNRLPSRLPWIAASSGLRQRVQDNEIAFFLHAQWSFTCATWKNQILVHFRSGRGVDEARRSRMQFFGFVIRELVCEPRLMHKPSEIEAGAHQQWQSLTPTLRLEGPLKSCLHSPFVRDIMVGSRLDYLHVLLRLALAGSEPPSNARLFFILQETMELIIEVMLQNEQLLSSSTSIGWNVAYYGLSAAGATCLWLLNQHGVRLQQGHRINLFKMNQSLSVFIAMIETGMIVRTKDPNYQFLSMASQTIARLLGQLSSRKKMVESAKSGGPADWYAWTGWDCEAIPSFGSEFWMSLASHPFLVE